VNKLLLEGKSAIVTGASEGIGYAIAELFIEEGCRVMMIARRPGILKTSVDAINAAGFPGRAVGLVGDVADESISKKAFETAIKEFGGVDILVNNAGVADVCTIETTTTDHWDDIMNINLRGTFFFCREAAIHFLPKGEGVIINVSSINGLKPGNGLVYTTSKGAICTMTRNMAIRFAGTNIRVNALCPGRTTTSIAEKAEKHKTNQGVNMRQFGNHYINQSIDGKIPPRGQAMGALFLASEMGQYMTGQNLVIEKGRYFN
jgi:3-oxoacyl-[acyl-carrier protein] reductase